MTIKLDSLPESKDKCFTQYEADTYQVKLDKPKACQHEFIRVSGTEVECQLCRMGFYITPEYVVNNKHIYINDKFVI